MSTQNSLSNVYERGDGARTREGRVEDVLLHLASRARHVLCVGRLVVQPCRSGLGLRVEG